MLRQISFGFGLSFTGTITAKLYNSARSLISTISGGAIQSRGNGLYIVDVDVVEAFVGYLEALDSGNVIIGIADIYPIATETDLTDIETQLDVIESKSDDIESIVNDIQSHTDLISANQPITIQSGLKGNVLSVYRYATFEQILSSSAPLSNLRQTWFTVKSNSNDADSEAIFQVVGLHYTPLPEPAPMGLMILNGTAITGTDREKGSISLPSPTTATIRLDVSKMDNVEAGNYIFDLKIQNDDATGDVENTEIVVATGIFRVTENVTQTI